MRYQINRDLGIKSAIDYLKKKGVYKKIRYTKTKDLIKLEKIIDKAIKINRGIDYRYN